MEAPSRISWSRGDRTHVMRVPAVKPGHGCVELRSPDPACNPYLAFAVCLAAGLDGMERRLTPPEEITENIFEMNADERAACGIEDLPDSLEHALDALEADPLMAEVLGPHIYTKYIAGKEKEWEEYCTRVSSWEIAKYMVLY